MFDRFAAARRCAMALAGALLVFAPAAHAERRTPLPLGHPGLTELRTTRAVAPGVTYTRIDRGRPSARDTYTIDAGFFADRAAARALAQRLRDDGERPVIERVAGRAPDDPQRGPLGHRVSVGRFDAEASAQPARDRLAALGYTGLRTVHTAEDGARTTGPWVVHALTVDPGRLAGRLDARLATDAVPGRELLSALAARDGAAASINGGYFVIGAGDGTPGDLAGLSMLDGRLVSEAVNGRTSLLLPGPRGQDARIAALATRLSVSASDGARREVDGLNREPGLIRGCGGTGGDAPTEDPKHDFTCTDPTELIRFTPAFGAASEPGAGAEAVLDADGRVVEVRSSRGGAIPANGSVLSGTGDAAAWLQAHARPGAVLAVAEAIQAGGLPLAPAPHLDVVNGGPRLLQHGTTAISAFAEGFHWAENPEFYYRFGVRRNPRTLAGTTRDGRLVLVAVDGRRPATAWERASRRAPASSARSALATA
jgi:hypothetical protein